ncbi:MAG: hypothetical protein JW940_14895 [Polyangiaceae bacterium]|nr:hypothetical protein [Polyangiaceae bacterium]
MATVFRQPLVIATEVGLHRRDYQDATLCQDAIVERRVRRMGAKRIEAELSAMSEE